MHLGNMVLRRDLPAPAQVCLVPKFSSYAENQSIFSQFPSIVIPFKLRIIMDYKFMDDFSLLVFLI